MKDELSHSRAPPPQNHPGGGVKPNEGELCKRCGGGGGGLGVARWGGGGGWHKASVSDCLPLAAPISLGGGGVPKLRPSPQGSCPDYLSHTLAHHRPPIAGQRAPVSLSLPSL